MLFKIIKKEIRDCENEERMLTIVIFNIKNIVNKIETQFKLLRFSFRALFRKLHEMILTFKLECFRKIRMFYRYSSFFNCEKLLCKSSKLFL